MVSKSSLTLRWTRRSRSYLASRRADEDAPRVCRSIRSHQWRGSTSINDWHANRNSRTASAKCGSNFRQDVAEL